MDWFTFYVATGIVAFIAAVVITDRHRTRATTVAVAAGVAWPVIVIGALQWALWAALGAVMRRGVDHRAVAPPESVGSGAPPL